MTDQRDRLPDDAIELGLARRAPRGPDASLLESIVTAAARTPQVDSWIAGTLARRTPRVRRAWIAILIASLLALAAIVVGGIANRPPDLAVVVTPPTSTRSSTASTASPLSGSNGVIAYSVFDDATMRSGDVHLVNGDGTDDRVIGPGTCPIISSDGGVITYRTGYRATSEVTVAALDGSSPRAVTGIGESEYAISPDGTHVAWIAEGPELWVTPVSGAPGISVAQASADGGDAFGPLAWSPDGRRIAFAADQTVSNGDNVGSYRSAIYVVDADGTDLRRLTARPGTAHIGFSWSPDGQQIAYAGLPDGSPVPSLGAGSDPAEASRLFWMPSDIFVVNTDGTTDRNLTRTLSDELDPEWSPDGSHLAYRTMDNAVGFRLATIRMSGASDTVPAIGPESDSIEWSPSGADLLSVTVGRHSVRPDAAEGEQPAFWGTFKLVDAGSQRDPRTLLVVENASGCPPSWRSLEP